MTLEDLIEPLLRPINGQRPRPWFTHHQDPASARVFLVGANQASAYLKGAVSHEQHMDALFNRNDQTCERLYQELDFQSRSRPHIDRFCQELAARGIDDVLQTNVVCYSTKNAKELSNAEHRAGRSRGKEIFRSLVSHVKPKIIVVHGVGSARMLRKSLGVEFDGPPSNTGAATNRIHTSSVLIGGYRTEIIAIPTLAMSGVAKWVSWQPYYFALVADHIAKSLAIND
ncbi:hypothetical protein [Achromobacter anxifer]|uniref:hypothetical protein n=1 Tax=Achromobacter anxifer TaxID=1287737 RepID=UPI0023F7F20F|nr:hypothetical protein [Achromobacter anxifer]MDF8359433.1 hypothetical protein [Achromobacter anxifer]